MTDQQTALVLAYHRAAIEDLGNTVVLLSKVLAETGHRLTALESAIAVHEFALYPEGRPAQD